MANKGYHEISTQITIRPMTSYLQIKGNIHIQNLKCLEKMAWSGNGNRK